MKPAWVDNQFALKSAMDQWIEVGIKKSQITRNWGGWHDEGNFTSTWDGYYLVTGNEDAFMLKQKMRDGFQEYIKENFYHGYYQTGEPHHSTEDYIYFLGPFTLLTERDREKNLAMLEDAAHHVGNWVEGIPEWFDWENRRFRSWSLGTEVVGEDKTQTFEVLDHFRYVLLALYTYRAGGHERYLDFAKTYCDKWLDVIFDKKMLPGALFPDEESERTYFDKNQRIWGINFVSQVGRINGSGPADAFLTLYRLTGEEKYVDGLRFAFDQLLEMNADRPNTGIIPRIMMKYRQFTGDTSYDQHELDSLSNFVIPDADMECRLVLHVGMGMNWDYRMPDGSEPEGLIPGEDQLTLDYQITKDESYLTSALDIGAKKHGASLLLREGRENPCDGRSISGVSRGAAIPLFSSVLGATVGYRTNIDTVQVKYFKAPQTIGLPEGVAALVEPSASDERRIKFYNDNETDQVVHVSAENTSLKVDSVESSGCTQIEADLPAFKLPAKSLAQVAIRLK